MQIQNITIHNFRSIEHAVLTLGDYTLMIGANNSGKTNVIDALRLFYEKDLTFDKSRDFPNFQTADAESWIDIEYVLTDDEYRSLKDEYRRPGNSLKVRKYFLTERKGLDKKAKLGIYGYVGDTEAGEHFYGAKNVQQGKLGDAIYVPAVSRLDDHTKFSGPSALRDLVNDVVKKLVKASAAFQRLTAGFGTFTESFKDEQTDDGRSLALLEKEISGGLKEWDAAFALDIQPIKETDIVKNLVTHKVIEHDQPIEAAQCGQGFQRHLIFTLIRVAAKYQRTDTRGTDKKDFAPEMTLLLFEEPEAYLHPTQQRTLCHDLQVIASQEGEQVLASSHSPHFVSHNSEDLCGIARLSREDRRTIVGQLTCESLAQVFAENQEINEALRGTRDEPDAEDFKVDMEAVKYFLWLNPDRCGMFFAGNVLLVEGATERVLIDYLLDTGELEMPKGGVFVLDCLGKFNMHRFMNLLGRLNVHHSVLLDDDGNTAVHTKVKEVIERSRNERTGTVTTIPGNLEDFLGIPKVRSPHRKPQHAMLALREGRIAPERATAFKQVVQALLPPSQISDMAAVPVALEEQLSSS